MHTSNKSHGAATYTNNYNTTDGMRALFHSTQHRIASIFQYQHIGIHAASYSSNPRAIELPRESPRATAQLLLWVLCFLCGGSSAAALSHNNMSPWFTLQAFMKNGTCTTLPCTSHFFHFSSMLGGFCSSDCVVHTVQNGASHGHSFGLLSLLSGRTT